VSRSEGRGVHFECMCKDGDEVRVHVQMQCVAVRCGVLQCVAVCCGVLRCVAVCCSVCVSMK